MSRTRILCLGDLHLGLLPSRLPAEVIDSPEERRKASTAAVWLRAVEAAIEQGVALVLLSGDVVDRDNRYFEAFGRLEEGLGRLAEAGIPVCAVAGNHDADVLERLEGVVSAGRLRLLGAGGRWERFTLTGVAEGAGRPLLHVDGWSFPRRDVTEDPTAAYDLPRPDDGAPVLGLLHGEVDRARSTNAPLTRAGLERPAVDAWLLGHLHAPRRIDLAGGRWALYPGSPQPLDPTETGVHGAWTVDVERGRLAEPASLALATVRYETIPVDLTGAETLEEARDAIARTVRDAVGDLDRLGDPSWLILRAALFGRTSVHGALAELARRLEQDDPLEVPAGAGRARLTEVTVGTRPAVDLVERSTSDDPVGVLAELLLALGDDGGDAELAPELLRAAREREREAYRYGAFSALSPGSGGRSGAETGEGEGTDAEDRHLRERLERVAAALLDALLDTRAGASGPREVDAP